MELKVKDFDICQIAESGQCFRWNKVGDKYIGIIGEHVCKICQNGDVVSVSGIDESIFNRYFDIEVDYGKIKEFYSKDKVMCEAIKYGEGIRILNQDKFEVLISFIISANNNIPRIKKSVEAISRKYGKRLENDFYSFPTPSELSRATEDELKACGVGFRAKYIFNTCRKILDGFYLEEVSKLPTNECKKELMKLMGVGPKVADCVMLFSMQKKDSFPVDVWIKRIMEELYIGNEASIKDVERFSKEKFGKYAGIAQQYLFFYAREKLKK